MTRIACTLDFDRPGKQLSYLSLAHSDNRHAYGIIPVPIALIANGNGPTVLLTAGNHGDEYEGQIILQRLLRELDPAAINGRLIVMPALNYPAVLTGARASPLDGGNMNRAFPGDPDGAPTAAIAHFVETELLPLCDAAVDLHSGGIASEYLPCAFFCKGGGDALMRRKLAAFNAFAAPVTVVVAATADNRSLSAAADRHGVVMVATELGGGGSLRRDAFSIGQQGVYRLLRHLQILPPDTADQAVPKTRFLMPRSRSDFVMASVEGIFEPYYDLGAQVEAGATAGCIHPLDDPARAPVDVYFSTSGTIICRRVPARVRRGDYVFHLGAETDPLAS